MPVPEQDDDAAAALQRITEASLAAEPRASRTTMRPRRTLSALLIATAATSTAALFMLDARTTPSTESRAPETVLGTGSLQTTENRTRPAKRTAETPATERRNRPTAQAAARATRHASETDSETSDRRRPGVQSETPRLATGTGSLRVPRRAVPRELESVRSRHEAAAHDHSRVRVGRRSKTASPGGQVPWLRLGGGGGSVVGRAHPSDDARTSSSRVAGNSSERQSIHWRSPNTHGGNRRSFRTRRARCSTSRRALEAR